MTISEMIKKFKLELGEKDGIQGIRFMVKPNALQIEELKVNKPLIMAELNKIEAARKLKNQIAQQERDAKLEIEKAQYLETANLKRYLVCYHNEDMTITWAIRTLELTSNNIAYQAKYFVNGNFIDLPHVTSKIKELNTKTGYVEYGMAGIAYEITTEDEKTLVAEQVPAIIEADKIALAKKIKVENINIAKKLEKELKIKVIYEKAKETGIKQLLYKYSDDCNDDNEECDLDMVYEYAMPDGTMNVERQHTW